MASGNLMMSGDSLNSDPAPARGKQSHSNSHSNGLHAQHNSETDQQFQHPMSLEEVQKIVKHTFSRSSTIAACQLNQS